VEYRLLHTTRLYEEAKETNTVIAAVDVDDPMEEPVMHTFEAHGARCP
jgi:hypothetical protein